MTVIGSQLQVGRLDEFDGALTGTYTLEQTVYPTFELYTGPQKSIIFNVVVRACHIDDPKAP